MLRCGSGRREGRLRWALESKDGSCMVLVAPRLALRSPESEGIAVFDDLGYGCRGS